MPSLKTGWDGLTWSTATLPTEIIMTQEELTKFLTMSENIQEQIQIAGELWDLSNFEIDALCGIVSDEFEANGITMGALI